VAKKLLQDEVMGLSSCGYTNIFAEINTQRQICNIGKYYRGLRRATGTEGAPNNSTIQKTFEELEAANLTYCKICCETVELKKVDVRLHPHEEVLPRMSLCGQLICAACTHMSQYTQVVCQCGDMGPCEFIKITPPSINPLLFESEALIDLPAKIQALRSDVLSLPREEKRYVCLPSDSPT
jgi:hypothetical protein